MLVAYCTYGMASFNLTINAALQLSFAWKKLQICHESLYQGVQVDLAVCI